MVHLRRSLLIVAFILLSATLGLETSYAEDSLQAFRTDLNDRSSSLTLEYRIDREAIAGLNISLFRVAGVDDDGELIYESGFDNKKINLNKISTNRQFENAAEILNRIRANRGIRPYTSSESDEDGISYFQSLPPGIYLVGKARTESEGKKYVFSSFLVMLPLTDKDGDLRYDVKGFPKASEVSTTSSHGKSKKTGDDRSPGLAVIIALFSLGVGIFALRRKRKEERTK